MLMKGKKKQTMVNYSLCTLFISKSSSPFKDYVDFSVSQIRPCLDPFL